MPYGTKITYKGYTFKSKHEFAWAQLFDDFELPRKYEPMCFRDPLAPPGLGYTYTPDFELYGGRFFVEIKSYQGDVPSRIRFCPKPLLLIFGLPDRHYIRFQPSGEVGLVRRYRNWWEAFVDLS